MVRDVLLTFLHKVFGFRTQSANVFRWGFLSLMLLMWTVQDTFQGEGRCPVHPF